MYRLCRFAENSQILNIIFPNIASKEYFDDRLADTLDAIYNYGIGNLEMLITRHMISHFDIRTTVAHNDTTSVSTFGNCDKHPGEGITITYGYSKKHRQDLKQFVRSLSVSKDAAFALYQQAYSGNTADVSTYVEQWQHLIDLLDDRDFLYVCDCKLASIDNMAHIHDNQGLFLTPAPMYSTYEKVFENALQDHTEEMLIPYKERFNRGFETSLTIAHNDKEYPFRMIILFDHGLCFRTRQTLNRHVEKTRKQFDDLASVGNRIQVAENKNFQKSKSEIRDGTEELSVHHNCHAPESQTNAFLVVLQANNVPEWYWYNGDSPLPFFKRYLLRWDLRKPFCIPVDLICHQITGAIFVNLFPNYCLKE